MATQSLTNNPKSKRSELHTLLASWESRYKLRVLSRRLPRAVMVGIVLSLLIGLLGYSQQWFLAQTFAVIALLVTGVSGLIAVLYTQFVPRPHEISARYFDVQFGLKERVSTALELLDGRIQTHPEIESVQIADALHFASRIDAHERITMDFRPREWVALALLLFGLIAMILVPLIVGQELPPETPSAAVREAQEDVRDITETIATDTDLEDVDRDELLNALEIALERLQEEDISDEEAFAAMSQLQSQIEQVENQLDESISLDQASLQAAAEALSDFVPPDDPNNGEDTQENTEAQEGLPSADALSQALEELSQNPQSMTNEEAQAVADALNQAAQELSETNPELAQTLQDMADALEGGDNTATQQQAQQAQQQLEQQSQQMQQNMDAQDMLQDQSDLAEQASNEIAQQQQQQSQQNSPSQQEGQSDSSSDQGESGQQGDQTSENMQQGDSQGNQQPSVNVPGESGDQPSGENSDSAGQGAGEGESSNASLEGSGGEDQGVDTYNQTTGDGIGDYEAIYNPTGIDGGGSNEIELDSDSSDQTLREGDFEDNPLGESRVTYDTVFNDYQDAANRALESDYVPLGLRDVVHDYFTSLEPAGGN